MFLLCGLLPWFLASTQTTLLPVSLLTALAMLLQLDEEPSIPWRMTMGRQPSSFSFVAGRSSKWSLSGADGDGRDRERCLLLEVTFFLKIWINGIRNKYRSLG